MADAAALAALGERTFRDTYAKDNRPEDMEAFVARAYGPAQQTRELSDPRVRVYLAEQDGGAVGFAMLRAGDAPACVTGPRPLQLARLYVDRTAQGTGVGAALLTRALEDGRARGFHTLWLTVWEHNPRASAFYARWGFTPVGTSTFQVGEDLQRDFVLARAL